MRVCKRCDSTQLRDRHDLMECQDCGWIGTPCWSCDGWISNYIGIKKGDHVSECPECGQRHYAAADWWEIPGRKSP